MAEVRILLLADTHIGFDLPMTPRVARRRRGHDLLDNYAAALAPALAGEVDVVVHGGDVFHRSRVHPTLAYQALEPLARVAERGVPVFIVPGNHERARLPHPRFVSQANAHVFDRPRTFVVEIRGIRLAISGFPSERRVRTRFTALLEATGWREHDDAVRLLCIHQCVEGAQVGPGDFTFTTAADVVRARDIPPAFAAVLSGHVHRRQVLTEDMRGKPLSSPVVYPGSLERLSIAEIGEPKGYVILHVTAGAEGGSVRWEFRTLRARPMIVRQLEVADMSARALDEALRAVVATAPSDAVLRVRVTGELSRCHLAVLSMRYVRAFAPNTMNVEIRTDVGRVMKSRATRRARSSGGETPDENLRLEL